MPAHYFAGVDVGGTNIKAVLLDSGGKKVKSFKIPSKAKNKKALVKKILRAIVSVSHGKRISAIGIALAGTLDRKKEFAEKTPNARLLNGVRIGKIAGKKFRVPVFLENDAKAAAFAESRMGAGRRAKRLLLLTLGTGIGSGIVINGKLLPGAIELGHTVIEPRGHRCGCGKKGCLEAMANARFIERTARELSRKNKTTLKKFDALSVQHAAEKGDYAASQTYRMLAENLGRGIKKICKKIKPDLIVLAGGIANAKMIYPIAKKKYSGKAKIVHTKLGDFCGAMGAALLAIHKGGRKCD